MSRLPHASGPFPPAESGTRRSTSIAFVESDPSYRSFLEACFAGDGRYLVKGGFESAKSAFAGLPRRGVDVVLLDVQLTGHTGVATIKRVHRRWPRTRCVVLTSSERDEDLFAALSSGAAGYLLKSEPVHRLIAAIDELVAGGVPLSRPMAHQVLKSFMRPAHASGGGAAMTVREREIMDELAAGTASKAIAQKLGISPATVKNHLYRVYEKLGVGSRTEAVVEWLRGGGRRPHG